MRYFTIFLVFLNFFNHLNAQKQSNKDFYKLEANYLVQYQKSPNDSILIKQLGDLYSLNGKWEEASTFYKKLIEENPKNSMYYLKYGGSLAMLAKEGPKLKAINYLNQAKRALDKSELLNPNHLGLNWVQIELYTKLPGILGGSFEKAWQYANFLEKLSKIDGYFAKAFILKNQNDLDNFKKYLKKGLNELSIIDCLNKESITENSCNFKNNNINFQIGEAFDLINSNYTESLKFLNIYLKNHSLVDRYSLDLVYLYLSKIHMKSGNFKSAITNLDYALKINPNYVEAIQMRERILKKLDKQEQ